MNHTIRRVIPRPMQASIRRNYPRISKAVNTVVERGRHMVMDTFERMTGKRDRLTPPGWIDSGEHGAFRETGERFLRYFIEMGKLTPHAKALEIGCGAGRMAVPLMNYLNRDGSYDGFDIVKEGIRWCQKNITSRAENFNFRFVDLYNYGYNRLGQLRAAEYRFPYDDETFDFVFLTFVFPHMLPRDMENYIAEISRVLKKGGRCMSTWFLLNDQSERLIREGKSTVEFKYIMDGYEENRVNDPFLPESAIAYPEYYVRELYRDNNLDISKPVQYGSWCGRKQDEQNRGEQNRGEQSRYLAFQDILSAVKT